MGGWFRLLINLYLSPIFFAFFPNPIKKNTNFATAKSV